MNVESKEPEYWRKFPDRDLSAQVIGAAIQVHKTLGPGFIESFYEEALCIELASLSIPFERQKIIHVMYQGQAIGEHRLDLLVAARLVVELKAVQEILSVHFAIVRSYMKAVAVDSGLILNFASMPLTVKRVGHMQAQPPKSDATGIPSVPDFLSS